MRTSVCLWPEPVPDAARRGWAARLAGVGLSLADGVEEGVWLDWRAEHLDVEAVAQVAGAFAESAAPRQLHVAVVPLPKLRWHLYEPARVLFRTVVPWDGGSRMEIRLPDRLASKRAWILVGLGDPHGFLVGSKRIVATLEGGERLWVGEPPVGRAEGALGAALAPPPKGGFLIVEIEEADEPRGGPQQSLVPAELPGVVRFDPEKGWLNQLAGGAPIYGRQNAPAFCRVEWALMAGTAEQFLRHRDLVRDGQARGVVVEAHPCAVPA